ncbi:hypothetical protein MRX96_030037 [Rhipicephalus microplus]
MPVTGALLTCRYYKYPCDMAATVALVMCRYYRYPRDMPATGGLVTCWYYRCPYDMPATGALVTCRYYSYPRVMAATGALVTCRYYSKRCTDVVKEVDRIKKQQEGWRARQLSHIEEKCERTNVDPGNLNWEFFSLDKRVQVDTRLQASIDERPI